MTSTGIQVVPENGEVNWRDLVTGKGTCLRQGCKIEVTRLQYHFVSTHTGNSKKRKRGTIKEIMSEEDEEVDVEEVFSGMGICNRKGCEKLYKNLQKHFRLMHTGSKYKRRRINPTKFVPAKGKIDVEELFQGPGICNRKGCEKEYKNLQEHFRVMHTEKLPNRRMNAIRIVPPEEEGEVNVEDLICGRGVCNRKGCKKEYGRLQLHFRRKHVTHAYRIRLNRIKIVTADEKEKVNLDKLTTGTGICNRKGCKKEYKNLQKHFRYNHNEKKPKITRRLNLIKVVPAKEDKKIDVEKLFDGVGFCNRKGCKKEYTHLQQHFKSKHMEQEKPKRKRRTNVKKIVPAEGEIDVEKLTKGIGTCNRKECEKEYTHLQLHFINTHVFRNRLITVIPAEEEEKIDVKKLTTGKGICNRSGCEKEVSRLQRHFKFVHLEKPMKGKCQKITKTVSADENEMINVEILIDGPGTCNRRGCEKEYKNLQRHFRLMHTAKKLPRKRENLIDTVPADGEGEVNVEDLICGTGTCNRKGCEKKYSHLQRHFIKTHVMRVYRTRENRITVIPANDDEEIDIENLSFGRGTCNRKECEQEYPDIQRHFRLMHVLHDLPGETYITKTIPASGKVKVQDVYSGKGKCDMQGCKIEVKCLRDHFVRCHHPELMKRQKCLFCSKLVLHCDFKNHLDTHSGPAKCSLCNQIGSSLNATRTHITTKHKGLNAVAVLLNAAEEKDYLLKKKPAAQSLNGRTRITGIRQKLDLYEDDLRDCSTALSKQARHLKKTFKSLFRVPAREKIVNNASFVTLWNYDWKTPTAVFEVVKKDLGGSKFSATDFVVDPKIPAVNQPVRKDYARSGFHRGHLASGSDFQEMSMVLATYYYSNIVPMYPKYNVTVRWRLEDHIRKVANANDGVMVIHFPIMEGQPMRIGLSGVRVPSAIGSVILMQDNNGYHIRGWELPHNNDLYRFEDCERDPFDLLQKAGLEFKFDAASFASQSHDA